MLKAVILAAGMGTRMKSKTPKVLHEVLGKTMVEYSIVAAKAAGAEQICIIIGHGGEQVKKKIGAGVTYVEQKEQLGTGHAVMCAKEFIGKEGQTLILCGDTPLIKGDTLINLVERHKEQGNQVTMLSTILGNPSGYGRIIRNDKGEFVKNVEDKDATKEERMFKEVNSGMYLFESGALYDSLSKLTNDNVQGEYYLPDTLEIIRSEGGKVDAVIAEDETEIMGVNSRVQLMDATRIMQERINYGLMKEGVTILAPELTFVGPDVVVEQDVTIYPNSFIYGNLVLREGTVVPPGTVLGLEL